MNKPEDWTETRRTIIDNWRIMKEDHGWYKDCCWYTVSPRPGSIREAVELVKQPDGTYSKPAAIEAGEAEKDGSSESELRNKKKEPGDGGLRGTDEQEHECDDGGTGSGDVGLADCELEGGRVGGVGEDAKFGFSGIPFEISERVPRNRIRVEDSRGNKTVLFLD